MSTAKEKRYLTRDITAWNVKDFHDYLIDRNTELFSADYVPFSFGRGALNQRWAAEKGAMKQAQEKLGNEVLRAFIDRCVAKHTPKPDYPHINFGYMWTYLRDEVPRAQADVTQASRRKQAQQDELSAAEIRDLL